MFVINFYTVKIGSGAEDGAMDVKECMSLRVMFMYVWL